MGARRSFRREGASLKMSPPNQDQKGPIHGKEIAKRHPHSIKLCKKPPHKENSRKKAPHITEIFFLDFPLPY